MGRLPRKHVEIRAHRSPEEKAPVCNPGALTVGMGRLPSPSVADSHETSASRTVEEMTAAATIIAVDVPVALLIALNLLRALDRTGPWSIAMRPGAAACRRIGSRVALITGCGCRGALLGECERGGSKREPDSQAKSLHVAHSVCSPTKPTVAVTRGARAQFPTHGAILGVDFLRSTDRK